MKRILQVMIVAFPILCNAQNLVPNPSFELYNTCPSGLSCLDYSPTYSAFTWVQAWINPETGSSSDYFNACATSVCDVPTNTFGYQNANTGTAYTGGYAYLGSGTSATTFYSEYIETKLTSPLVAGAVYQVSFYVNLINTGFSNTLVGTDRVGVHFSDTVIWNSTINHLQLSYDVVNTPGNYLTDTVNWMKVSGLYTAKGGERYMVLGCFEDGNPITFQTVKAGTGQYLCYYYYDDISVAPGCDTVTFKHDTAACSDQTFSLGLKSGIPAAKHLWNTGDTTATLVVHTPGTYVCSASNGCFLYIDTFNVKPYIDTKYNRIDTFLCKNVPSTNIQLWGQDGATEYLWSTGDKTAFITITDTGIYWCRAIKNCNLNVDTFHVGLFKDVVKTSHDSIVCRTALPFRPQISSIPGAVKYEWSTGDSTQTITVTDTGTYWCQAQRDCLFYVDTFRLRHKIWNEVADLGPDSLVCRSKNYKGYILGVTHTDDTKYTWSTGDTVCCIKPNTTGTYYLYITDGCTSSSDTVNLEYINCDECIFHANAFTPNNDGHNDYFRAFSRCILKSFEMTIFDRFGQVMFKTNQLNTGQWDGTYNGQDVQVGTYFYQILYKSQEDTETQVLKGDLTLIR